MHEQLPAVARETPVEPATTKIIIDQTPLMTKKHDKHVLHRYPQFPARRPSSQYTNEHTLFKTKNLVHRYPQFPAIRPACKQYDTTNRGTNWIM